MTWKPRHEAHAIERVRLLFSFREPLPSKILARSSGAITDRHSELGFNAVEPAESSVATIRLDLHAAPTKEPSSRNGFVMKRHADGEVVEEVGFRDLVFGYMTKSYGRWEAMKKRLEEVLLPALDAIDEVVELETIKLEYWDSFFFEGEPTEADASGLLASVNTSIPEEVLKGSSAWHSHAGWFEQLGYFPILINRNFDIVDRPDGEGNPRRALGIYTLVEQRSTSEPLDIGSVRERLDDLHKRSLRLFGTALSDEYRERVGINVDDCK